MFYRALKFSSNESLIWKRRQFTEMFHGVLRICSVLWDCNRYIDCSRLVGPFSGIRCDVEYELDAFLDTAPS